MGVQVLTEASDPLELALQNGCGSPDVGARNGTQGLCKSSVCF